MKLTQHYKSIFATIMSVVAYIYSDSNEYLSDVLPINGKPLAIFTVIVVVVLYELILKSQKDAVNRFTLLKDSIDKGRLIQEVNRVYDSVERSGTKVITNEYLIKEIAELTDLREKLKVNSYTQGKLTNLNAKIKII